MTRNAGPPPRNIPADDTNQQRRSPADRRRVRAGIVGALCVGVAALAGIGFAPWTFSKKALIDAVAQQVHDYSGLYVAIKGRTAFSLLPRPRIVVEGIVLAEPTGAAIAEVEGLSGEARLAALLGGRLELARISLSRPRVTIDLAKAPGLWRRAAAPPTESKPRPATEGSLRAVDLVDASVKLGGENSVAVLEHLDATLEWNGLAAPTTLQGAFDWRGERLRALLWVARPGAIQHGDPTPLTFRLNSPTLMVEAEGLARNDVNPRFTGRLSASAPSLRQALAMFDRSPPLPGPFDDFKLAATASLGLDELQLSQLRLSADGNAFEGALELRREDGRLGARATLSSNFLSLKPMLAYLPTLSGGDGQWSRDSFDIPDFSGVDADVGLIAAHARLARLAIDDAELTLGLRSGRLELTLARAKAYKGAVKAHATLALTGQGDLDLHASAQTAGIDAGALLWDANAREDIGGLLDSNITLDSRGDSVANLMLNLGGRGNFVLTQGAIAGIDFERALSRLDKRPLSSALESRAGRSSVEKASGTVKIADGVAEIDDGQAFGPGFALAFRAPRAWSTAASRCGRKPLKRIRTARRAKRRWKSVSI